jgi:hypothetical protein
MNLIGIRVWTFSRNRRRLVGNGASSHFQSFHYGFPTSTATPFGFGPILYSTRPCQTLVGRVHVQMQMRDGMKGRHVKDHACACVRCWVCQTTPRVGFPNLGGCAIVASQMGSNPKRTQCVVWEQSRRAAVAWLGDGGYRPRRVSNSSVSA